MLEIVHCKVEICVFTRKKQKEMLVLTVGSLQLLVEFKKLSSIKIRIDQTNKYKPYDLFPFYQNIMIVYLRSMCAKAQKAPRGQ